MIATIRQKLKKDSVATTTYVLNLTDILPNTYINSITSTEATGVTVNSISLNSEAVTIDGVVIAIKKALTIVIAGGVSFREYRIIVNGLLPDNQAVKLGIPIFINDEDDDYYGSMYYAGTHLRSPVWDAAEESDRLKALIRATRAINRLNFAGSTTSEFQFPRGDDTTVPLDIECACYEEAIILLDGAEPQKEMANLSAVTQGFSAVRTTYDRSVVPESVQAGIMSHIAWTYLIPFLRDPNEVILSRV